MPKTIQTTCGYCAVGCNMEATINDDGSIKIKPVADYPVNQGMLCPKGMTINQPLQAPDRDGKAYFRNRETGEKTTVSMDQAIKEFVKRLKAVEEKYGEGSTAYYSTGQYTMEDFAALGVVGRIGMGMEGDGNTRLCMASAVVGYKQTFGFDAPPFTYEDLDESDCIILVGANPAVNQPVLWNRYKKKAKDKDHDLIVIDPRKTETGNNATLYLPMKAKSDLPLFYIIANTLIQKGWIKQDYIDAYTNNFETFKEGVKEYTLDRAPELCNLSPEIVMEVVEKIHQREKVSFWWTMGVNQSQEGSRIATTIIAICLMTGNIGRVGTGGNSITGQCNAMGSRLNSVTTSLLGGRDFANEQHRKEAAEILGIDPERIPKRPTKPIDQIVQEIHEGKIKFLWILATNPAQSFVDIDNFIEALGKLDTLVVQDLYGDTKTALNADIFIPAAGSFEKDGTFINMERRIGAVQKVLDPPGDALSDFEIFKLIAKEYGCEDVIKGWNTQEDCFQVLKRASKGRPCDFSGIKDRQFIVENGGIQWPFPEGSTPQKYKRLFEDGKFFTENGKANFHFEDLIPRGREPGEDFPFIAITGRATAVQFHTSTRTQRVPNLLKMVKSETIYIEANPEDMKHLNLNEKDRVKVTSPYGSFECDVFVNDGLQEKHIFIPMHYLESNVTIPPVFDKYSKQPSFKYGVVQLEKVS